jgi:hypothetical protein
VNPKVFRACLLAALGALVVAVFLTLGKAVAADRPQARAPIVEPVEPGLLLQTGWYSYPQLDDAAVLYCVREPDATLTCVMYAESRGVGGILFFQADEEGA